MPRRDGTGPMGMGSMTGRGAGFCTSFTAPSSSRPVGYGCGLGKGRGFRQMFISTSLPGWARFGCQNAYQTYASDVDEKELLKRQAELLENQLNDVKKRLANVQENNEE